MGKAKNYLMETAVAAALFSAANAANAVEKLYSPYVEKGEWELEYFGSRTNDDDSAKNNGQGHEVSIGYGVNDWWRTEISAGFDNEPQENARFNDVEWENAFQLTERGQYWVDVGALLAYEYTPESSHPDTVEGRLLLAKDIGKTTNVLNIILEKDVGSGDKEGLEGGLLWSTRYDLNPYFQPGFEISSEFGELKHTGNFNDQEHYVGPTAYGRLPLGFVNQTDAIGYRVGYLFGVSDAASSGDAVLQLEYEIHF